MRLVKSMLADKEEIPLADVVNIDDEEAMKEESPPVRKNSKKIAASKGKRPVSEKEILSEEVDEVEKE